MNTTTNKLYLFVSCMSIVFICLYYSKVLNVKHIIPEVILIKTNKLKFIAIEEHAFNATMEHFSSKNGISSKIIAVNLNDDYNRSSATRFQTNNTNKKEYLKNLTSATNNQQNKTRDESVNAAAERNVSVLQFKESAPHNQNRRQDGSTFSGVVTENTARVNESRMFTANSTDATIITTVNNNQAKPDNSNCLSKEGVAIMVPYRDREYHLKVFIKEIVPFIQRQNISFHIFVIEQSKTASFNRAKLFNIGYNESQSVGNFSCYIFHDVDLIPTSPDNYYCCERNPIHMAVGIEKFNFQLPYADYAGGVLAMTKESFQKINGFSNVYFGWGGEDDDMDVRIKSAGLTITRPSVIVGRYKALKHLQAEPSQNRNHLLGLAKRRLSSDGINSLHYSLLTKTTNGITTHIIADLGTPE